MIKAVIFDLDGIIVDSEPLHFEAAKKTLNKFGIDLTLEDYLEFGVAKGAKNLFDKLSEKYGVAIDREKAFLAKSENFKEIFEKKAHPREGIAELIKRLDKDYVLAIASSGNGNSVQLVLDKFNFKNYFKAVITAEDVEKVKPFPDIYLKCCATLGLENSECVAIEDSETGLQAAKAAGIKCIVVPCDFTRVQNFSDADLILNDFSEIGDKLF